LSKLVKTRCTRDITKYFFSNKVINRWNLLDQRKVDAPSINTFKSRLVYIRDNRMGFFTDYSPLSTGPHWLDDLPVRLHKANNKVNSNCDLKLRGHMNNTKIVKHRWYLLK